jgi:hypothetical protein
MQQVSTVVFVVVLLSFAVTAQQQQQSNFNDQVNNNNVEYQQRALNRRAQQGYWPTNYEVTQKPRRTHYGQTLSRFFDSPAAGAPQYASSTPPPGRQWNNRNRWSASTPPPRDGQGRVRMGVSNGMCDNAKTNLTVDWDMSPVNHTCYHPENRFPVDDTLTPLLQCDRLPARYVPGHLCMSERIHYPDNVPTHGDHRPLWPVFGEYIFVPRERWLHNIEHGAVVMLYHPCAHPAEVAKLKKVVKSCIGKHVITPSTLLTPDRPLALVAWSCRLLMSSVDEDAARGFIQQRGHKGPEGTYRKEGQFTFGLLQQATMTGNGAQFGYSRIQCVP